MGKKFKIDFIGIGTIRGGSTWVYKCLGEHPEIRMSDTKESKFFSDENLYSRGIEYYQSFFEHHDSNNKLITGEFDPGYLHTPGTAERIKQTFPDIKLIMVLRNPSERAYSHFKWHEDKGKNLIKTFDNVIANPNNIYINVGRYYNHLQTYLKLFDRNKILVLILEDSFKNPLHFIQNIYKFLEVDDTFIPNNLNKRINHTGISKVHFPIFNKIIFRSESLFYKNPLFRTIVLPIKKIGIYKIKHKIRKWNEVKKIPNLNNASKISLPEKYLNETNLLFKQDKKKLEKFLGRDLKLWE